MRDARGTTQRATMRRMTRMVDWRKYAGIVRSMANVA